MSVIWWLAACGSSFEADMKLMCEAAERPELQSEDPSERAMKLAEYLKANLTNAEVKGLFAQAATMDPETRTRVFEEAVRRAGLTRCAILEP